MPILTRGLRVALPLLLAALSACKDGTGSGDGGSGKDRVAPVVTVLLPVSSSVQPGRVHILGSAADSGSIARATYQVDDGAETALPLAGVGPRGATFAVDVSLPGGAHRLVVHAYDPAGNRGSSGAIALTVDASGPRVQLATPAAVTVAADTVRVRATVTDDHRLSSVELRGTGTTQAAAFWHLADRDAKVTQLAVDTLVTLAVGANEISLLARDSLGNETRVRVAATRTPAPAPARLDAIASSRHGCGLRSGAAYCWGEGAAGELGNGRSITRDTPVPVAGGLTFSSLSVGWGVTCGVTTAGQAYCWGADVDAALGRGSPTASYHPTPQRVATDVPFASVSVGMLGSTTCGVAVSGEAYCWGSNSYGQAGVSPSTSNTCYLRTSITMCVVAPARVQGGLRFTTVSAGGSTSCGIAVDGRAHCWGVGLLGTGEPNTVTPKPVPVPVAGGHHFTGISVGNFNVCGVTTTGEAYCWGSNRGGALGDGTTEDRLAPTRVASAVRFRSVGVMTEATSSGLEAGACAQAEDGAVYCWGGGRLVPTRLEGGLAFTRLSPNHRCGITADRTAYCWTLTSRPVPVPGDYP